MTLDGSSYLGTRFEWHDLTLQTLELHLGRSNISRSLLCAAPESQSEFAGGADAWGTASAFIDSAAAHRGYDASLKVTATSALWFCFHWKFM